MRVWILADQYSGSTNQSIALAKMLGVGYELKKLDYNMWASIPNFMKFGFVGLKAHSINELNKQTPDLVISAGRRCAAVAKTLKQKYPSCKTIQILRPGLSLKHYDALIIPEHDKIISYGHSNKIIRIHGALSFYPPQQQKLDRKYWEPRFEALNLHTPRIAVLIGGVAKKCIFDLNHAKSLVEQTIQISKILGASLLISTSRRTPAKVSAFIKDKFGKHTAPHIFYEPNSKMENPYRGFLSTADYLIVTGDSIYMLIEALETHKPVYLFYKDGMLGSKHKKFIDNLMRQNFINTLENFTTGVQKTKFNNSDIIRDKVLKIIGL